MLQLLFCMNTKAYSSDCVNIDLRVRLLCHHVIAVTASAVFFVVDSRPAYTAGLVLLVIYYKYLYRLVNKMQ